MAPMLVTRNASLKKIPGSGIRFYGVVGFRILKCRVSISGCRITFLNTRNSALEIRNSSGGKCKDGDRYPLVGSPSNLEMILIDVSACKEVLPFVLVIISLFLKFRGIRGLLSVSARKNPYTPLT